MVKKGKDVIKTGVIKKIVLSRFEKVELKEYNTLALFGELLKSYKNAFVYCWFHPKVGLWLGATPESLLKVDGQKFETMSLAGTQLYQGSLDVKWNGKENEEQQIVTDFIVDSIKPLVHVIKISKVKTIRAGNILHLMTKISGTLITDLNSIENLLKALHPTPAICGLPVNSAKKFILKNEHYNRAFYTGYLGELNIKNKSDLYVNLRCMQIKGNESIIYVGGGITNDSIPESEWEETVNKSNTIKNVLLCS